VLSDPREPLTEGEHLQDVLPPDLLIFNGGWLGDDTEISFQAQRETSRAYAATVWALGLSDMSAWQ
jgi:hypothetical protein